MYDFTYKQKMAQESYQNCILEWLNLKFDHIIFKISQCFLNSREKNNTNEN